MDSGISSLELEKLSRLESEFINLLLQINSELKVRKQNETGESFCRSLILLVWAFYFLFAGFASFLNCAVIDTHIWSYESD